MTAARPPGFNEVMHFPVRLSIVALLAPAAHVEFSYLREATGLSDSALSKQLTTLQEAGYVDVRRTGRRATAQLTSAGRRALNDHAHALRVLLGAAFDEAPAEQLPDAAGGVSGAQPPFQEIRP